MYVLVIKTFFDIEFRMLTNGSFPCHSLLGAGASVPTVKLLDPNNQVIPVELQSNGKGLYRVEYTATISGTYQVEVLFGGNHIPGSVFNVSVAHGK